MIHVMLDLSAAFDTLDHSILLHRLFQRFGVSGTTLQWFTSYLSGRSQQVVIDNQISSPAVLKVGVPQGSVLGPILFNAYTTPLADIFDRQNLQSHCYADDSQLYIVCKLDHINESMNVMNICISQVQD